MPTSVRAEDKLAVTFELPPAQVAPESLVRYQERLPPIVSLELETTESETTEAKVVELEAAEPNLIRTAPSEREEIALQFAQNDVAVPTASAEQGEKVGTIAEAFLLDQATENLLAAAPETDPAWLGSNQVVKSLQQHLTHSSEDQSALSTDNILKADILEDWIYDGGSDSLVARTVGSAEGTRKSDGRKTTAYYGHTDPGNGVWNLGTFSYQHEAVSPEEADEKQLKRLQYQEVQLKEKAAQWNVPMSMEVRLNGLDLANQAPLAALDKGGYMERLAEAYQQGMVGEEAIAWARTQAYFDPDRQDWDAPGLGNNPYSIQRDQERRMAAIDQALRAYEAENGEQDQSLQAVKIAARPEVANPLLDQPKSPAIIDFSLESASATEQADIQSSDTLASSAIAPDNSLSFEGDRIDLDKRRDRTEAAASETNDVVESELTLPAALSSEIAPKAATSTKIADNPQVLMRAEKPENAQKETLIRTEDSIVRPK